MNQKKNLILHPALGSLLESLRCRTLVKGKRLRVKDVCQLACMSASTYEKVKRAPVSI